MSDGFPNCFHMGVNQTTLTPNFPHLLDEQARHIAHDRRGRARQAQVVEPTRRPRPAGCRPSATPP